MIKLLHIGLTVGKGDWISEELKNRTIYREIQPFEEDVLIRAAFDEHKPDCVFMQIQQADAINLGLIEYMSKKAVLINWCGDVRDPLPAWYVDFDKFCVTAFSNMRDVDEMECEYLQIGIDTKIYHKKKIQKDIDVVYMANWSAGFPLSGYRMQAVNFLRQYKNFKIFGGWPGADGNLMKSQYEENNIYNRAKIGISISHFCIDRYFSDRLIRSMGSGCFTLSHYYPGIERDFEIGGHLDVFHNLDELKEKINYYLEHDFERNVIAMVGYNYVRRHFTTKNMVDDILRIYEKNKSLD